MTPSMTPYKCGDVVLLPFPFTDLSTTKQRPALIISSDWYNDNRNDIIVVAITSHIPAKLGEEEYLLSDPEQKSAGLPKPAIVKVTKIIAIDHRLIRRIIGHLPKDPLNKVKNLLNKFVG